MKEIVELEKEVYKLLEQVRKNNLNDAQKYLLQCYSKLEVENNGTM